MTANTYCSCYVTQQEDGSERCDQCRGDVYACDCPTRHKPSCEHYDPAVWADLNRAMGYPASRPAVLPVPLYGLCSDTCQCPHCTDERLIMAEAADEDARFANSPDDLYADLYASCGQCNHPEPNLIDGYCPTCTDLRSGARPYSDQPF